MSWLAPGHPALRRTVLAAVAVTLGSTCLHAVLTGDHWYPPILLVVVVVALIGAIGRRLSVPSALLVLVQPVGVLVVVTALYAHQRAFGGFVPTPASVSALGALVSAGVADLRAVLAPTYPSRDLSLLAVGGVGLVATAVDLVAVGARRPAFAGLPLVLLVAVPAAIRERSVGLLPLVATVIGFLLLLSSDSEERTSRWGRVLPNPGAPLPSAAASNVGAGVRIGIGALALAALVPFAIPGARTSPFGSGGLGNGSDSSSAVIIDPLSSVQAQLTGATSEQLLTVRTAATEGYLRLTALDVFDDSGFRLGSIVAPSAARVSKGIAAPTGVTTAVGPAYTETITASDKLAEMLLPVPEGTTGIDIDGDWRLAAGTRTVFSANDTTRAATWTVTASAPQPTVAQLAAAGGIGQPAADYPAEVAGDLSVPPDLPAVVADLAKQWTDGATSAYAAAEAIQQRFTDGSFRYDTSVAFDAGPAGFGQFLAGRAGFCEQYATTMAAMLRTLGVPARVAIGFVGGTRQPDGSYAVTGGDAHAWPEVWLGAAGWVRFEPTPRSDGLAVAPAYAQTGPGTTGPKPGQPRSAAPTPSPSASTSAAARGPNSKLKNLAGADAASTATSTGGGGGLPVWLLVAGGVVVLTLLTAVPGGLTARRRRRRLAARGDGSVELVWNQLVDDATDLGVLLSTADSPRGVARRVVRVAAPDGTATGGIAVSDLQAALGRLVEAVEVARYAPANPGRATGGLATDEAAVRRVLAAGLPRGRRLVVRVAPASARDRIRGPLNGAGPAVLSAVDRLSGGLRRLRPRGSNAP